MSDLLEELKKLPIEKRIKFLKELRENNKLSELKKTLEELKKEEEKIKKELKNIEETEKKEKEIIKKAENLLEETLEEIAEEEKKIITNSITNILLQENIEEEINKVMKESIEELNNDFKTVTYRLNELREKAYNNALSYEEKRLYDTYKESYESMKKTLVEEKLYKPETLADQMTKNLYGNWK